MEKERSQELITNVLEEKEEDEKVEVVDHGSQTICSNTMFECMISERKKRGKV